jgi:hypothetical protein
MGASKYSLFALDGVGWTLPVDGVGSMIVAVVEDIVLVMCVGREGRERRRLSESDRGEGKEKADVLAGS